MQACFIFGGNAGEVGVFFQPCKFAEHGRVIVLFALYFENKFGQVKTFHVDAVALQGHLVEANRLECGGACADTPEVEPFHAFYDAADCGKVVKILAEGSRERVYDVRFQYGEGDFVLIEDVGYRELPAKGVAAVREVHFPDLIGVCLHENGDVRILQCRHGAVLVDEDGHAQDDAVIFALMALEPVMIQLALVARFHGTVACGILVHEERFMPRLRDGFDHVGAGACDELRGHKTAVPEK